MLALILPLLFLGAKYTSTQAAEPPIANYLDITNIDAGTMKKAHPFFREVLSALPNKIKNALTKNPPKLGFASFKESTEEAKKDFPLPPCGKLSQQEGETLESCHEALPSQSGIHQAGSYLPKDNAIVINARLLKDIEQWQQDKTKIRTYSCGHENMYRFAQAALVHEIAHHYDFHQENSELFSNRRIFRHLSDFKKHTLRRSYYPQVKAINSPDPYEYQSIEEKFAVNMEFFVLDSEYACRRPSMFTHLKDHFQQDLLKNKRKCKPLTQVQTNHRTIADLDPKQVYQIDYAVVSPGSGASGLGHALLRFVVCRDGEYGPECLKEKRPHLYLSYSTDLQEVPTLTAIANFIYRGLKANVTLISHSDVILQYVKIEDRSMAFHRLILTEAEKTQLVHKALEHLWDFNSAYRITKANCATMAENLVRSVSANEKIQHKKSSRPNAVTQDLFTSGIIASPKPDEITPSFLDAKVTAFAETLRPGATKKDLRKYLEKTPAGIRLQGLKKILQENADKTAEIRKKIISQFKEFESVKLEIFAKNIELTLQKGLFEIIENDQEFHELRDQFKAKAEKNVHRLGYGIPLTTEGLIEPGKVLAQAAIDTNSQSKLESAFNKIKQELETTPSWLEYLNTEANIEAARKLTLNVISEIRNPHT